MYHCWWTSCPREYLSDGNFTRMMKKVNLRVAETSPSIKRYQTGMSPDTGMSIQVGPTVPHVVHRDIANSSNIVNDDKTLWYKNADTCRNFSGFCFSPIRDQTGYFCYQIGPKIKLGHVLVEDVEYLLPDKFRRSRNDTNNT